MPVLLLQKQRPPTEVLQPFRDGHFVAKLPKGKFNSIWMDYTTEATENKALEEFKEIHESKTTLQHFKKTVKGQN